MTATTLTIAMISDVFPFDGDGSSNGSAVGERLYQRLSEARQMGAELAVLPELPLNPWSPATKVSRAEDAEPVGGVRATMQADAARKAGIGLVGGAVVMDAGGVRRNTALVFDHRGELLATYCKLHLPEEEGFWETSHYDAGVDPARPISGFGMPLGVQICSDANRPEGCHLLGALGAEVIVIPRASELKTWPRWSVILRANAQTSCAYVLSVNRPAPEQGVLIGGPSFAAGPDTSVLLESTDAVSVVTLSRDAIRQARIDYPGYLPVRSDLYASAWAEAGRARR